MAFGGSVGKVCLPDGYDVSFSRAPQPAQLTQGIFVVAPLFGDPFIRDLDSYQSNKSCFCA